MLEGLTVEKIKVQVQGSDRSFRVRQAKRNHVNEERPSALFRAAHWLSPFAFPQDLFVMRSHAVHF